VAWTAEPAGQPPLTVVTYGGALMRSQMRAVFGPYRKQSGRWVSVLDHHGGIADLAPQVHTENVTWDVVNLDLTDAIRACDEGLLEKIDPAMLPPAADGTPAEEDFYPLALLPCSVGHNLYTTVVGYDPDAFDEAPTKIADFFDLDRFPGRRGLRREPLVAMDWALVADGVAREDLHTMRGEEGVARAFRKLDEIRDHIVWWTAGEEGPALIDGGVVTMGAAWNGRIYAANQRGGNIGTLWDNQVGNLDVWVIPRGSERLKEALRFIRFATGPEVLARHAGEIPYGPARQSAIALIPDHIREYLPTTPERIERMIRPDFTWWADNVPEITALFESWIRRKPVYDFHDPDRN
jgi:putative spermidine/putrescine transport system substrate-binding protein